MSSSTATGGAASSVAAGTLPGSVALASLASATGYGPKFVASSAQQDKARQFARLHQPGAPLLLFNAWDAGSARTVAEAGACAIATGSQAVAAAHGYADGQLLPLPLVMANLQRILAAVSLPVSLDLEAGYARDAFDVARNVRDDVRTAATPLIMISSRTADKHQNLAKEIGVDAFFGKPVQDDELIAKIKYLLASKHVLH